MAAWAVIPLKSPHSAKSRLSGLLSEQQRVRLFYALARRVINVTLHTSGIGGVTVVTASDAVVNFAINLGAQSLRLENDRGTAQACSAALEKLPAHCLERVLFVAGDIPLITSNDLLPFVAFPERSAHVVIAPDRVRLGTNVLLCAPGNAIPLCFGNGSFAQHVAAAARLGIAIHVVHSEALELDIDESDDLQEWRRRVVNSGQAFDADLSDLLVVREKSLGQ